VPAAVQRACDSLKGTATATAGASVAVRDHWSNDDAWPTPARGCGLDVSGSFAAAGAPGDAVTRMRDALIGKGWNELPDFAADGKDGTAFAYRSGDVACFMRGQWDGGTDDEPALPGGDWYKAWVFCADYNGDGRPAPKSGSPAPQQ
jgi:hypothetical protein